MQTVQLTPGLTLPYQLLLPMSLIKYNSNSRQLVIRSNTLDLPQPIVVWLQISAQHRGLLSAIIEPAAVAAAPIVTEETYHPLVPVAPLAHPIGLST